MSLSFQKTKEYLEGLTWTKVGLTMLAFSIGIVSLSTVYIAGFLFGLSIEFSALVDSEIFYRSIQELIFIFSLVIVYLRLIEVQLRATLKGARRRGTARRRLRKIKNLPPPISQSAKMSLRYFLAPMLILITCTALFVLLISKFLDVRASLSWLAFNAIMGTFSVWLISRFNSKSSKSIRSLRMLWRSVNSPAGDIVANLFKMRGVASTLSVSLLLSASMLGASRFQTLVRAQPSCIETPMGRISASLLMQTGSGYIFVRPLSDAKSLSNRKIETIYLEKDTVLSISSFCILR